MPLQGANPTPSFGGFGLSHREMEFIQGLRWSLEDVSRIYGVPMPLLSDLQKATLILS